jgi:hypothetical protein
MKYFFLLFLFVASCASTSKKDDLATANEALLTQSMWTSITSHFDYDNNGVFDPQGEVCETDNTMVFKTDKTYRISEGPTACDPTQPPFDFTDTWDFGSNGQNLLWHVLSSNDEYFIEKLDEHQLILVALKSGTATPTGEKVILTR